MYEPEVKSQLLGFAVAVLFLFLVLVLCGRSLVAIEDEPAYAPSDWSK